MLRLIVLIVFIIGICCDVPSLETRDSCNLGAWMPSDGICLHQGELCGGPKIELENSQGKVQKWGPKLWYGKYGCSRGTTCCAPTPLKYRNVINNDDVVDSNDDIVNNDDVVNTIDDIEKEKEEEIIHPEGHGIECTPKWTQDLVGTCMVNSEWNSKRTTHATEECSTYFERSVCPGEGNMQCCINKESLAKLRKVAKQGQKKYQTGASLTVND